MVNNSVHYYLSDHLNSTSMVISSAGVVEDESDYSAFGTEYPVVSSGTNHYKFSGKERDSESQLDYFGARYYSNAFGRFLTPDWAAKATSVPYANFGDPQTLNLYGYVRNIPTSLVDGDGHGFVNGAFQDWGFELGDVRWGIGTPQDAAPAGASVGQGLAAAAAGASAASTASTPSPGFLDKLEAFFSTDSSMPDSFGYKRGLIKSMVDDLLGNQQVSVAPNEATDTIALPASMNIPVNALRTLASIDDTGKNLPNQAGGQPFRNQGSVLPSHDGAGNPITYTEWDTEPSKFLGQPRTAERIVTGSDGSAWYTDDHYKQGSFTRIR